MNLLHVIPYYAPAWAYGGSVRAATELTRALVRAGHRVTVLTTDTLSPHERAPALRETLDGVEVVRVRNLSNALRGRLNLSTPRGMAATARALIVERQIDLVHCHELRTVETLRVAAAAKSLGVPVVVSPHGTLPTTTGRPAFKRAWDRLLGGRLLSRCDGVIALTRDEAADARALWAARGIDIPIHIVPNGVHLDEFAALPARDAARARWSLGEGPVVLFLGRLHARKGLQLLLPAFAGALAHVPEARLLVAGPDEGMLAALTAQARALGLTGGDDTKWSRDEDAPVGAGLETRPYTNTTHSEARVLFTGLLAGPDRLAALAAADLFALPAEGEGFSVAALEALACGLPALLTPGCHFPEAAEAGAGVVVPREVESLRAALVALLSDADRRAEMGRAARGLVEARYTWPQIVTQMEAAYAAVLARKRP
ncbi:MAG: glycosyltransferase [Anaerolineae bacterium]|nr:glycosyltransferase [Anaerolineae bacterium]